MSLEPALSTSPGSRKSRRAKIIEQAELYKSDLLWVLFVFSPPSHLPSSLAVLTPILSRTVREYHVRGDKGRRNRKDELLEKKQI